MQSFNNDYVNIWNVSQEFANFLNDNRKHIQYLLRQYESKEVVDDEIKRSIETLRNIDKIKKYLGKKISKISAFLPLNLPLYSLVIFAIIPSFQSEEVYVRSPERMTDIITKLFKFLSIQEYFKGIKLFTGQKQDFIDMHCKASDGIIFTGKYENYLKIREQCGKNKLIIFNGVGHNPIIITDTADIDLAVEKTIYVKLFNGGQDCAGPDIILVHSNVVDVFLKKIINKLKQIKTDVNYDSDKTKIGPVFESMSIFQFTKIIESVYLSGGKIIYGGNVDYKNKVIYPCVCKFELSDYVNYNELYGPIFLISEYEDDSKLDIYFNDPEGKYARSQMYVSIFGENRYVANCLPGTIPLVNVTIHDAELGVYEYGGYGVTSSGISYKGINIPKPILIPREIYRFLISPYKNIFEKNFEKINNDESNIIELLFKEKIVKIFGDNLVFGYIFGSYARNRAKSYSDIDTFVCVKKKDSVQIKEYLDWLFEIFEIFGKIPDFKYPTEIVELKELENQVARFSKLRLLAILNSAKDYDAMVWLHSLSHYKIGIVNEKNIPDKWITLFPENSKRILREFLIDLKNKSQTNEMLKSYLPLLSQVETKDSIDEYIRDLGNGRRIIEIFKQILFEQKTLYDKEILEILKTRDFFGKELFNFKTSTKIHDPMFRFGVV